MREHRILEESLHEVSKMIFNEVKVFHIGQKPNKIDFLTKVQGLTYEEADKEKKLLPLKESYTPVINYNHLIILKMLAGRPQDKADVDILQKINRLRKKD